MHETSPRPALALWSPDDTEESVLGTHYHQDTITNARTGVNEGAGALARKGGSPPFRAGGQTLITGLRRPDGSAYPVLPDVFVYPYAFDMELQLAPATADTRRRRRLRQRDRVPPRPDQTPHLLRSRRHILHDRVPRQHPPRNHVHPAASGPLPHTSTVAERTRVGRPARPGPARAVAERDTDESGQPGREHGIRLPRPAHQGRQP